MYVWCFFSSERRKDLDDTPSWVRSVKDDVDDPTGDFKKIYQMLSTKPLASIAKPALSGLAMRIDGIGVLEML